MSLDLSLLTSVRIFRYAAISLFITVLGPSLPHGFKISLTKGILKTFSAGIYVEKVFKAPALLKDRILSRLLVSASILTSGMCGFRMRSIRRLLHNLTERRLSSLSMSEREEVRRAGKSLY